jgi:hypothetical protein
VGAGTDAGLCEQAGDFPHELGTSNAARWGCAIEEHYSRVRGSATPMDIEWAKDGRTGELFVVQARPETVHAWANVQILEQYRLRDRGRVLVTGRSIGGKIATGTVRVIPNAADRRLFQPGEVLVTDKTDPDWEPIMKKAAAIVTNRGGRTCHAAICQPRAWRACDRRHRAWYRCARDRSGRDRLVRRSVVSKITVAELPNPEGFEPPEA